MMLTREGGIPREFAELIDECRSLIDASGTVEAGHVSVAAEPLPSLLEQVRALIERPGTGAGPIRLVHHFACTGGTLIAKCLASMPNVLLLSEVAPHSRLGGSRHTKFMPTDLIRMVRTSLRGSGVGLESKIFLAGLQALDDDSQAKGLHLVLRDHSHSKYCTDDVSAQAPSLRTLVSQRFAVSGVVTVRHPLDSFLSLRLNEWVHFEPPTLEEYARRYHSFLDDHDDLPRYRYEDLLDEPPLVIEDICESLSLSYVENFEALLGIHQLSGDSGRAGSRIGPRPRRKVPAEVMQERENSRAYTELCSRLRYDA